jgi:glucokinase
LPVIRIDKGEKSVKAECGYILLDVGGTQIKCAVADQTGQLFQKGPVSFPALAKEESGIIFDNFAFLINEMKKMAGMSPIAGVSMAFPGPFDYVYGISLMKGLDKYDSIYGIPLVSQLKKRLDWLADIPFQFLHDVEAFAVGESWYGKAADKEKIICLCIGTGAGSAFVKAKRIQKEEKDGVPENGWLYNAPYRDGVIDDYLSVRGLTVLASEIYGSSISGKELYHRSRQGEEKALLTFQAFGDNLKDAMVPFLDRFKPDALVMGGQISKSFAFFGDGIRKECLDRNIVIFTEDDTSGLAMLGLFVSMKEGV